MSTRTMTINPDRRENKGVMNMLVLAKQQSSASSPSATSTGHANNTSINFGDYQNEIYVRGLRGERPRLPTDFKSLETKAMASLPGWVISYVQGACGDERTQELNVS